MIFLRHKAIIVSSAIAAVMGATLLGSSLTYAFSENYKSWKQYDSSWSSMYLGKSSDTVRESGCAVTAAAILMVHSGSVSEKDFDPGVIVAYLNQHGGFNSSGLLDWNALSGYTSDFYYVSNCDNVLHGTTEEEKAQEIKNFLDEGYYVMVRISSGNSTHFVAIDTVQGSKVIMMDPGSKYVSLFEKYPVSTVTQVRLFKGKNSPADMPEEDEEENATEGWADTPETAPVMPAVFETEAPATTIPETTEIPVETFVTTETTILTTAETTTTTTTTTTTETTTTTTTTTTALQTEPIILTAPVQETVLETSPAPLVEEIPEDSTVEFVILQDAPEFAPSVVSVTTETTPIITGVCPDEIQEASIISVPYAQAQAKLFELGQQHVLMSIRFTLNAETAIYQNIDDVSNILTVIPAGTSMNVVETDDNFQYGRVSYNGTEGWISLNFAEL